MPLRPIALGLCLLAPIALGEEAPDRTTGKAELGFLATSGNTDTSSLNAKLSFAFDAAKWRHSVSAAAVKAEDSGVTTAERYQFGVKSDYKFNEHDYLFVTVNWEQDEFAGFHARTSEAIGYGRRLISRPDHHLDLEIGAGARQTDLIVGPDTDESILRASGKYLWSWSESSSFEQSLVVEKGDVNTYSESASAVTAKLGAAFGLKFSYTIKHNSEVAPGLENTDTYTAVSLEYAF